MINMNMFLNFTPKILENHIHVICILVNCKKIKNMQHLIYTQLNNA